MKSNDDIPEDEMMLAKMLQSANARELKWTCNNSYRRADGYACSKDDPQLASCCAAGAFQLDESECVLPYGVTAGNDYHSEVWDNGLWHSDWESLGYAFRTAMKEDA